MKYFRNLRQQSAGDTIVEVLLALTVLSLIIGASSVLANRSTKSLQAVQENSVAQRLAQSQLELFRSYIPTREAPVGEDTILADGDGFCMVETLEDDVSKIEPKAADSAECSINEKGLPSTDLPYKVKLTITSESDGYTVRSRVEWAGLTVDTSQVDVDYRVYDKMRASFDIDPEAVCGLYEVKNAGGICIPADPSVKVVVRAIAADGSYGNLTQPSCSKTSAFNGINGVAIRLTQTGAGASAPQTKNTISDPASGSVVRFSPLQRNGTYSVNLPTIPSGYELCGSEGQTRNVGALIPGVNPERTVTYTLRPLIPSRANVSEGSYRFPGWHLYTATGARQTRAFTFSNPGAIALSGVSATLSNTTNYQIWANSCWGNLQPYASCAVTVAFTPPGGAGYNSYGQSGDRHATLTLSNNNGVAATGVGLVGRTYSDMMAPGDAITTPEDDRLVSYNPSCYNDAGAAWCPRYRIFLAGNGNLYMMNNYCAYRGDPEYNGSNASIHMQTDGNFVYYGTDTYRWVTWTNGMPGLWAHLQSNGYARLTYGYNGGTAMWLNANNDGSIGCSPRWP